MNLWGHEVIMLPLGKMIPARRHRKKRINKKWLKRYGMKWVQTRGMLNEYYQMGNKIIIPEELWGVFRTAVAIAGKQGEG